LGIDLLELIESARAAAGTDAARVRPCLGRTEVGVPEWPSATLAWPGGVHTAFARLAVKKDAISIRVLMQAFSDADFADISRFELGYVEADFGR
jgi:hypothetical protein